MKSILIVLTSSYLASCLPPPHPAVVQVRREEESLPLHLRSRALWNPHLQQILPLTSLLHHGEEAVFEREADKVPRQEIYGILTHAGFLPRRPPHQQPDPRHRPHQQRAKGHHNKPAQFGAQQLHPHFGSLQPNYEQGLFAPYLGNPEYLQYL